MTGTESTPADVIGFWFGESADRMDRDVWFRADPAFDAAIRRRFEADVAAAIDGARDGWLDAAKSCLALILLLDQMPRNLFRGDPRAWSGDPAARAAARLARDRGYDLELAPLERGFIYMPFMHSEDIADQRLSEALFEDIGDERSVRSARRHREIIERFGRFPHRNAVLGRPTSAKEREFLNEPDSSF